MTPDPLTADFDFALPDELVAQYPAAEREGSRLLVLPRNEGSCEHTTFDHLPDYLRPGDLLVLNDTRVFPARLLGRRVPSGGEVECLLLGRHRGSGSGTRDLSPAPRLLTPEFRLPTPDSQVPTVESRVPSPESRLSSPESRVPNPERTGTP